MTQTEVKIENASRKALYRGLIALAWADHDLHPDEKSTLHEIINTHTGLSDEDRVSLRAEIEQPVALADVWADITDPQDRARLIDMANVIFQQDNDFSDDERQLIEQFQAKHLASIKVSAVADDLAKYGREQAGLRAQERAEYKEWAKQYSLFGSIKRAVTGG